jgi:hypothetical protein
MGNDETKLKSLEFVTYCETKKYLKAIAEYDFSTRQTIDPQALELMAILIEILKENRRIFGEYFTYCQYLLMFPKRRSKIAMQILEQPSDRNHVKDVFAHLVNAAIIRHKLLTN